MRTDKLLPCFPVVVVHFEDPPGSGLAACCGYPFMPTPVDAYPRVPRWLCAGCWRAARNSPADTVILTSERP